MRTPERKRLQRPREVKTIPGSSTEGDDVVEAARRELCRIIRHLGSGILSIFSRPFISLCHCRVENKTRRIRRVKYWQAIHILALAVATVCEAQSPLDAPGEKKVIVCSEIARGAAEIFSDRNISRCGMNLICLESRFDELITNSKSRQKDSDGFMLGVRTEQVNEIDSVAHNDTRELFNTHEG